jgi:hypothetical protein
MGMGMVMGVGCQCVKKIYLENQTHALDKWNEKRKKESKQHECFEEWYLTCVGG